MVIDTHHIPDMASAYGYFLTSNFTAENIVSTIANTPVNRAIADANGNNIVNTYATKSELTTIEDTLQAQIDSVSSRDMFDELTATTFFADTLAASIGYFDNVFSNRFYLDSNTYFELDSDGYVHLVTPSGKGLYTEGFISSGGISNDSGSSGVDLPAVWSSLEGNTGYGANRVIDYRHIPDTSSTYGYQKASDVSSAISTAITALNLGTASTHAHTDYVTAID
jgi:hypothetical protein